MSVGNPLKTETAEIFHYQDLERAVKEFYGLEIEILRTPFADFNQDSYESFDVNGEDELYDIDDDGIVAEWINSGENPTRLDYKQRPYKALDTRHLLHRLYKDGHIPSGKYLMMIWW